VRQRRRAPRDFFLFLLFPLIGMLADLWLLVSLDSRAIMLGLIAGCALSGYLNTSVWVLLPVAVGFPGICSWVY